MAMLIRGKRVSEPELEERVKARSWYASSGSEHDGEPSSLSELVYSFLEAGDEPTYKEVDECSRGTNVDELDCEAGPVADVAVALQAALNPYKDSNLPFLLRLYSQVVRASEAFAALRSNGSGYRRAVMVQLRQVGYNAGICKARWEGSGGLTAGNYEYIDIVMNQDERYIVDLEFASQFGVARATPEYERLMASLPNVMVCRGERLRQVVKIMAEAARRSLKIRDLSVPPWRKSRHILAKWLGPYRRTVNPLPSSAGATVVSGGDVKCRAVGFKTAPPRTFLFH